MNNHDRYNYDRPNTAQLVDLHIYVVPPELWSEHRNSAVREVINDTISAGFIRVQPETNINGLREEIENQLGGEHMPNDYVFLRSVGRCMTRIRPKQEYQLKVRNFTPPQSYAPEIFVLEASLWRDHRYSGASSSMRSDRSDFSGHPVIPPITDKNKMMQTDLEDRRRLEETIRRRIEEEETLRRRDREERENESRRRELEEKRRFDDERNEVERRRREEEDRRRREEEDRRSREEEDRRSREEEARRSREEEDRRSRDEEEKRRRDEEERRSREEDDRRRRDEEDRKKREDEEWKNKEEDNRRKYDDDKRRDDHAADDEERWRIEEEERRRIEEEQRWVVEEEERRRRTEVETTRYVINDGDEKAKILRELEELREGRVKMEQDREEMVKRIKGLQGKSSTRRNQARDVWKKKYFDEKKRTPAHEEKTNKLRQELENLHRRIMSTMEGNSDGKTPRHGGDPSTAASNPKESNLKIQATKYQHELDELHRKVENIKMRLTAEMKLRTQAETELRALRAELTQKKINVTLTRSQQYQAIGIAPPLDSYPAAHAVTPRT